MKIKSFLLSIILFCLLVTPVVAIDLGDGFLIDAASKAGYDKNTTALTLAETIGLVIKAVLSFAGVIFLVLMVYAGYLWMTARGEEEQIKKSQKIIISSVIGLVITVSAYSITEFVVPAILARTTGK